jgi:hypothetical protein
MAVKYYKWSKNIPTFTIQRPAKIYPNLGFLVLKQTIWQPWVGLKSAKPMRVSSLCGAYHSFCLLHESTFSLLSDNSFSKQTSSSSAQTAVLFCFCLSVCLSVCQSACLFVSLHVQFSVCSLIEVFVNLCICLYSYFCQ